MATFHKDKYRFSLNFEAAKEVNEKRVKVNVEEEEKKSCE